jgi:hypothetical protein
VSDKTYRKMMQFVSSYTNDPYMSVRNIINKYGENIPKVTEKPTLAQYGLSEDIESTLKELEDKYNKKVKYIQLAVFIFAMIGAFLYGFIKYGTIEIGIGSTIAALVGYGIIFAVFIDGKFEYKKNTELHKKHFEYKKQLDLYDFWNQVKRIDYWMNLNGHEFEEAVASVYRNLGYKAEVSKQGGDGGIDIILTKENRKIAVQCKAHNKPVGPSVVRDLFGTMNHFGYDEGILASRNGFTVGVYEFVKDKPIKLVNLNDIIAMIQ